MQMSACGDQFGDPPVRNVAGEADALRHPGSAEARRSAPRGPAPSPTRVSVAPSSPGFSEQLGKGQDAVLRVELPDEDEMRIGRGPYRRSARWARVERRGPLRTIGQPLRRRTPRARAISACERW